MVVPLLPHSAVSPGATSEHTSQRQKTLNRRR
jgi:hypothetical protein